MSLSPLSATLKQKQQPTRSTLALLPSARLTRTGVSVTGQTQTPRPDPNPSSSILDSRPSVQVIDPPQDNSQGIEPASPQESEKSTPTKKRGRPPKKVTPTTPTERQKLDNWTLDDDRALVLLVGKHDKDWDEIAHQLQGSQHRRTQDSVESIGHRYRTMIGKNSRYRNKEYEPPIRKKANLTPDELVQREEHDKENAALFKEVC